MCDIQYEEIDSKEKIYKELQDMLLEGSTNPPTENITSEVDFTHCNITTTSENEKEEPAKLSELYSNFTKSFQEKCKVKSDKFNEEMRIRRNSIDELPLEPFSEAEEDSDINSLISDRVSSDEETVEKTSKMIDSETGVSFKRFYASVDELKETINSKYVESGAYSGFDEQARKNDEQSEHKESTENQPKYKIKYSENVASFSCDFSNDDEENSLIFPKKTANSTAMVTCGTETDEIPRDLEEKQPLKEFTTQADSIYFDLEQKIMPFVKNPHTIELKLRGQLSLFQRACVKQIASQNQLWMKGFGKGRDSHTVLRKKTTLLETQKVFLEIKKAEKEKQLQKVAELKARQERLLNPPKSVTTGCQVDFLSPEPLHSEVPDLSAMSKNERKRYKKKKLLAKLKQQQKRHNGTQTVEEGYYVCPYCEDDIPELLQHIHYPYCVEKYRNQNPHQRKMLPSSIKKSKAPTDNNIKQLRQQFDQIHDNDINRIVQTLNSIDGTCSSNGCKKNLVRHCSSCNKGFCLEHYNITDQSDKCKVHLNCPIELEKKEIEKQKQLGSHNPLLKTVEELKAPKFQDGSVVKRRERRQQLIKQYKEQLNNNNNAEIISESTTRQTHTTNGPLLNYERNQIKQRLKEKIDNLNSKRTK